MPHPLNREYVVTYMDNVEEGYKQVCFRTMCHFYDWFNSRKIKRLLIISITERPGDERFDKYYKKDESQ